MKTAFDSNLETQDRDKVPEHQVSHAISREVSMGMASLGATSTITREEQEKTYDLRVRNERTAMAGNYFALASPIMPLGILGAFFLLGKFVGQYDQDQDRAQQELFARQREMAQSLYLTASRKAELDKIRTRGIDLGDKIQIIPGASRPLKLKRKRKPLLSLMRRPIGGAPGDKLLLSRRGQAQISELVKQKTMLQSAMDQVGRKNGYHAHSQLSARLDLLDKALKRAGC